MKTKFDVIIVLGYPPNNDGSPSPVIIARVNKAIELFQADCAPRLLFTGGGTPVQAQVMAAYAQSQGVPADTIFQEPAARDTRQNAENSVKMMQANQWKSALVVTSPYHLRRAAGIFSRYNLEFGFVRAHPPQDLSLPERIRDILHEIRAYLNGVY